MQQPGVRHHPYPCALPFVFPSSRPPILFNSRFHGSPEVGPHVAAGRQNIDIPVVPPLDSAPRFVRPPPSPTKRAPDIPLAPAPIPVSPKKLVLKTPPDLPKDPAAFGPYRDKVPKSRPKGPSIRRKQRSRHLSPFHFFLRGSGGKLREMRKEIVQALKEDELTEADRAFMKQLEALNIDRVIRRGLQRQEEIMERAFELMPDRLKKQEQEVAEFKLLQQERLRREKEIEKKMSAKREEEKRKLEEEEHERRQFMEERHRQQVERHRKAEEKRLEEERQWVARREEERAEELRIEKEKKDRDRRLAEFAAEIELRRVRKLEEASRREAERISRIQQIYTLYDAKWAVLKAGGDLSPILFHQIPWPVLHVGVQKPSDITYEGVREFVFSPLRIGVDGKSPRDRIRMDILKWHPDKFNITVLTKMTEEDRESCSEAAGTVVRMLMKLAEEVQNEEPIV